MVHLCVICGVPLVKIPGPGRWPKRCPEHRSSKRAPMSPEERAESARRAAMKRWETWQSPELRQLASSHAKRGASVRWAGHRYVAEACGHDVLTSGVRYCGNCIGTPVRCAWLDCGEAVGHLGDRGRRKKWCDEHRRELKRVQRKDHLTDKCSEVGCDRAVRARGVCNMHYKRILRTEGRLASEPWNDRRKNNHYRRRALMTGADAEGVQLADVVARDGLGCGICGAVIDQSLKWPDPYSLSLDHIVPLSRGGAHSLANCQLAHLRCNISKGARVA